MGELLFAVAAGMALAALSWELYLNHAQLAENREKANALITETAAFLARAETGIRSTPFVIENTPGFDLPGNQRAVRGAACWLDSGDAGFSQPADLYLETRTCVPCADSAQLAADPGFAAIGSVACTAGSDGLPQRCPTQLAMRQALPTGARRQNMPANVPLRQGIWVPADSLQDAVEILHLFESSPQFSRLPPVQADRVGDTADPSAPAGVFLCI